MNFLIKQRSSGKFFSIDGGSNNPQNDTSIVLRQDVGENMHWTFENITGHWGYIKHVSSGKIIHPAGGSLTPENDTILVVHSDRHWGALFALDAVNDFVIHKGGKFTHPEGGSPSPTDNTRVVLHSHVHDAMRFQFVSPSDPDKAVLVYGNPAVSGTWKIISLVGNLLAEHVNTLEIKIGKSNTESRTSYFEYSWETSTGVDMGILKSAAPEPVQLMMDIASPATWSEETTLTREIRVSSGQALVTWQYVFDVQQNDSKSVFHSNLFADTVSVTDIPDEVHYTL